LFQKTTKRGYFPNITFSIAGRIGLFVLVLQFFFITLVRNDRLQMIFSDLMNPLVNILASAALFKAARHSARTGSGYANSWFLWSIGMILYTAGSIIWAVLDLVVGEAPFPSPATFFYILFYLFIFAGLTQYAIAENHENVKKTAYLDNGIVLLGVGLSFWVFLFRPLINLHGLTPETLMDLIYPGLGMASIWYLMIFFRIRVRQSSYIPLLMIAFGLFVEIIADSILVYQTVNNDFMSGGWTNLGFLASSISFMLAAIRHVESVDGKLEKTRSYDRQAAPQSFSGGWPAYLPYIWLAVAYSLLLINLPVGSENIVPFLVIGLIISLVIFRQVLTLSDNEQLYHKTQQELIERKHAEEALRKMNLELDARVEQRTADLNASNQLLVQYNKKIESSLHEKEVLLKEIHHRVKNNLQTVSSLLNLQSRLLPDPAARAALQESQMRVRSMALIHEKLYQSENLSDIQLRPYIENLAAILFRSYQAESGEIRLQTHIEDISVGIDAAVPIGLILNELISNALKHAFPEGRSGNIQIDLFRETSEILVLSCRDNGRGIPDGLDIAASKSLGMQLVSSLTRQLEGEVEILSENGLLVCIRIPQKINPESTEPGLSILPTKGHADRE
jgi:two-component sensor histidine kinase